MDSAGGIKAVLAFWRHSPAGTEREVLHQAGIVNKTATADARHAGHDIHVRLAALVGLQYRGELHAWVLLTAHSYEYTASD